MKTADLIFEAVQAFLSVLQAAIMGDKRAQKRIRGIIPDTTYTAIVKKAQDELDREKFGTKGDN